MDRGNDILKKWNKIPEKIDVLISKTIKVRRTINFNFFPFALTHDYSFLVILGPSTYACTHANGTKLYLCHKILLN